MTDQPDTAARHVVEVHGITHGAEGVARLPDGKVCFVPHTAPGETVAVEVVQSRSRWARARLLEVVEAHPERVEPPCPLAGAHPREPPACGGCALQHLAPAHQRALKHRIVAEQLARVGRFANPPVAETVATGPWGYRSRARFSVDEGGRLGFHQPRSDAVRHVRGCPLLTDGAQALRAAAGDGWAGCRAVEVHAGARGGGLLVRPGRDPLPTLPAAPRAVAVADVGPPVALRGDPVAEEHVDGLVLRVSAGVFFQAGPQAARALVAEVRRAAGDVAGRRVWDLYAGVGLFAAALAADGAAVTAVERHPGAVVDARANLAGTDAEVVAADVDAWLADRAGEAHPDVIVLDPPRRGAGPAVCAALLAARPARIAYVSCDPAALARDARALVDVGAELREVVPVDCFPHTAAIEAVATFTMA